MADYKTPKGMRDYYGAAMEQRRKVIESIERIYRAWGYQPLWTPALETLETLNAKKSKQNEGQEGEGESVAGAEIAGQIFRIEDSNLGMRFDLTVPLARFASSQSLPKPYKRYAIAPVWRREEPQKGRLREFLQADADIIGSFSMKAEAELLAMAGEALKEVGISDFEIRLNNRKILKGMIVKNGLKEKEVAVLRALDKIDKIGADGVKKELSLAGLEESKIESLMQLLQPEADNFSMIKKGAIYSEEGARELEQILELLKYYNMKKARIDFLLVRGLSYYTGPIFEIVAAKGIGSIAGGGRYDKLLGIYGQDEPAVGISLGIERIMEIIREREEKEGKKAEKSTPTDVFVISLDPSLEQKAIEIACQLRLEGLCTETDLNDRNARKQLEYANACGIPFALFVGKKEIESKKYTLKNLQNGEQKEMPINKVVEEIKKVLKTTHQ